MSRCEPILSNLYRYLQNSSGKRVTTLKYPFFVLLYLDVVDVFPRLLRNSLPLDSRIRCYRYAIVTLHIKYRTGDSARCRTFRVRTCSRANIMKPTRTLQLTRKVSISTVIVLLIVLAVYSKSNHFQIVSNNIEETACSLGKKFRLYSIEFIKSLDS